MRSFSPQATRTGHEILSRSTTRAEPERIVENTSSTTEQRIDERASSTASWAGIWSPRVITSRMAKRRMLGRRIRRSVYLSLALPIFCVRVNHLMIRAGSARSDSSQPPPGEIATTLRARPRLAISRASAPPIELPAKCAVSTPSSSSSVSKWSAAWAIECAGPSGGGGPPSWPCSVGAITSKRGTSSASTGSQQRQVAVKPCTRTSGSPSPARYRAGEISEGIRGRLIACTRAFERELHLECGVLARADRTVHVAGPVVGVLRAGEVHEPVGHAQRRAAGDERAARHPGHRAAGAPALARPVGLEEVGGPAGAVAEGLGQPGEDLRLGEGARVAAAREAARPPGRALGGRVVEGALRGAEAREARPAEPAVAPERLVVDGLPLAQRARPEGAQHLHLAARQARDVGDVGRERRRDRDDDAVRVDLDAPAVDDHAVAPAGGRAPPCGAAPAAR